MSLYEHNVCWVFLCTDVRFSWDFFQLEKKQMLRQGDGWQCLNINWFFSYTF